jgi:hypothetical protein
MARKKKNPAAVAAADGAQDSFASGAPYHQKNQPENDTVLDSCREAQQAASLRKALNAARLESAALALKCGFVQSGPRWLRQCPGCKRFVELRIEPNGEVYAISHNGFCDDVLRIQQLLVDEGFQ